ncbi:hypothetical protein BGW39_007316 [Mortierella sp. 14UC]|nr:hypothetical protein BGW39_007316 [Mortierella sp. 14UC]
MIKTNTQPPHTNSTLVETPGTPIILRYPNSCLAPSSTSNTTVYLVGVSPSVNGRLEINSINLSDINSPYINFTTYNEEVLFWRSQSTLFCHNYPSYKPSEDKERLDAIHVQQFEPGWTFDTNIYPTSGKIDYPTYFPEVALTSARNYVVVGHSESASWSLAHTNTTNAVSGSTWTTFQLNPVDSFKVFSDDHMDRFPAANPFLSVGTYTLDGSNKLPARGHAIIFDTASSGWIYSTSGYIVGSSTYGGNMLQLDSPVSVSMKNITLTHEAVGVTMGFDAYILDKASDNTTIAYYINPVNSTSLQQVATKGHSPRYSSSLVATSMGSQIVVYSSNANGPRFNIFDPSTRAWAGLDLDPQDTTATAVPPLPTNSDSDFGSSDTSTLPLPSIIGGVLGGLIFTTLAIFFFVRYRSRRRQNGSKQRKNYDRNSKSELLEEHQQRECLERMLSTTTMRSPQFNPAQPCHPLPAGRSLGRNPQSPVLEDVKFFPAQFDSRGSPPNPSFLLLQCPLTTATALSTGAAGIPPSPFNSRPDLSLAHHHAHPSSSSLAPTLTDLTYQQHPSDANLFHGQHGSRFSSSSSLAASATTLNRHSQAYSEGASNFEHMSDYVPTVMLTTTSRTTTPSPPFHSSPQPPLRNH